MVATSYIMAVEDLEFMVSATEKLNFKFYVILINLIKKPDSYWKLLPIWNNLSM